jgi:hypothetical protein
LWGSDSERTKTGDEPFRFLEFLFVLCKHSMQFMSTSQGRSHGVCSDPAKVLKDYGDAPCVVPSELSPAHALILTRDCHYLAFAVTSNLPVEIRHI